MKTGLAFSLVMHAGVIAFGVITLSAPRPLEVADVEALPVDIIPVESITQVQQGEKTAPVADKPAPVPTARPDPVDNAKNVGDNEADLKSPPVPEPKPKEVETAAAAKPEPVPPPEAPAPEPKPEAKPEPVPATEKTAEAKPRKEVAPDPVAETIVAENQDSQAVELPKTAPTPEARPEPPKAETAKAPQRKESEKPAVRAAAKPKSEDSEFNADEIAALLDKEKPSGGGARRSTEEAALGAKKTTTGQKLTQSEMDALRGQIQRCWNVPAGAADAENLRVSIRFKLDPSGAVTGSPSIVEGGGSAGVERVAAESARRAILQCQPYTLPAGKYDAWSEVLVHFDPSDMF